jgi:hypothetical protein
MQNDINLDCTMRKIQNGDEKQLVKNRRKKILKNAPLAGRLVKYLSGFDYLNT